MNSPKLSALVVAAGMLFVGSAATKVQAADMMATGMMASGTMMMSDAPVKMTPLTMPTSTMMMSEGMDLMVGSRGESVITLQTFLETHAFLVMPAGVAKGYFGPVTKAALIKYQASVDVPATGYYGAITRSVIAHMKLKTTSMMKTDDSAMMQKPDSVMMKADAPTMKASASTSMKSDAMMMAH